MFLVIVADDSADSAEKTSEIVRNILTDMNVQFKLQVCTTSNILSKALEGQAVNLIITSMIFEGKCIEEFLNGKNRWRTRADIIILSQTEEDWRKGFDMGAAAYLVQPVGESVISRAVKFSINRHQNVFRTMTIKDVEGKHFFVRAERIIKIEIMNKELYVSLSDGRTIHSRRSIADLSCCQRLPFIRCHNSYYVNLDYAMSCERYSFTLKNGDTVPISKTRYKEIREIFRNSKMNLTR